MKDKKKEENQVISGTGKLILLAVGVFIVLELLLFWEIIRH